jgi:hypothetical protein
LAIIHILVLKEIIEHRKIWSTDLYVSRTRELLLVGNNLQNIIDLDGLTGCQEPSQCIIDQVKSLVFGGI